ncbi:phage tail tube protein [Thalassovita sp.]|uniref:phage tail tube protein n=1 Tax=Thalassovita sp. TaxID=1979401 RepID=UPI0028824BAD|nr:phage tail tube protein [Thalassovita sp.]MDF1801724.1 phage tail tube protein [Thalassovita sp.]
MSSSGAVRGYGSTVRIGRGETPAWTKLTGVEEFDFPDQTPDDVPVTHLESPSDTEEGIPGMKKLAAWSLNMHYVPGNASDVLLMALADTREAVLLELTAVGAGAVQYAAYVKSWRPTGIKGTDKMMAELSMTVMAKVVA